MYNILEQGKRLNLVIPHDASEFNPLLMLGTDFYDPHSYKPINGTPKMKSLHENFRQEAKILLEKGKKNWEMKKPTQLTFPEMGAVSRLELLVSEAVAQIAVNNVVSNAKPLIYKHILDTYGVLPQRLEVSSPKGNHIVKGITHEKFETVLKIVSQDIPVFLTGPAGSGKNVICKQVSEALGLEFYFSNAVTQEYKITGFIDANGNYQETQFFKAFTNGGLFMLDEIDASTPEVLVILNAAIANRYFDFPTGRVTAHEDFRVVAAGNTFGTGCLHGDTEVRIVSDNNKRYHNITIENLYNYFHGTYPRNISGLNRWATKNIKIRCVDTKTKEMKWTKLKNVIKSGVKKCWKLTDEDGNEIIASETHPFFTEAGFTEMQHLSVGDFVYIDSKVRQPGNKRRNEKDYTHIAVKYHPGLNQRRARSDLKYPPLHRLVYEADMNGYKLEEYIDILNNYDGRELKFVDTSKYNIHHIDRNPQNNRLNNLQLLTIAEHSKIHDIQYARKKGFAAELRQIVSKEYVGEIDTYDIQCEQPFNNFMANNFIVHNSDIEYSGRYQLDAASLDRFAIVEINYSEAIEEAVANGNKELVAFIRDFRDSVTRSKIKFTVSYRAIERLSKLEQVFSKGEALKIALLKGLERDDIRTINSSLPDSSYKKEIERIVA